MRSLLERWVPAPDMVEKWTARFDDDRWAYVVAVDGGEVVGMCGLDTEGCEVVNVYVSAPRGGVGSALVDAIEDVARARGCTSLLVESGSWFRDTAYGFWTARCGEPFRVDEDFYAPGAERLLWRLDLTT